MRILAIVAAFCAIGPSLVWAADAAPAAGEKPKNWTPPAQKIYAQALSDRIMAAHPELQSVTFHGTPPGTSGVYTMFAGSYPERIGNPDDPDDIDVITKGITIVDPRWHRMHDPVKKFVVQLPLRDAAGENIGLLVLAYHDEQQPKNDGQTELKFFRQAVALRDGLQSQIQNYQALFDPAAAHANAPPRPAKVPAASGSGSW